ncbi:hypothetical protein mvi_05750 [Methylobacterium indicum]|uniref:Uncharacterized protein n=1 Tax=Methylobacterium indicum TaxID=1775910 RepID=A0A8H8WPU2_9HYPH|nr:hypothetical protein mvi_05750 [Methylobacterium indicum]
MVALAVFDRPRRRGADVRVSALPLVRLPDPVGPGRGADLSPVRVPRKWRAGGRNRGRLTASDMGRSPGHGLGEASVESSARSLCNRALLSIIGPAAFSIDEPVAASSENARAGSIDPFDSTPGPRAR